MSFILGKIVKRVVPQDRSKIVENSKDNSLVKR